ncbi:MAG: hypothetical protein ACKVOK_10010 [Flavobacteriales bacterium]
MNIKNIYRKIKTEYWPDPVWSKVISVIIVTVGGSILTGIWVLVKYIFFSEPFSESMNRIGGFLSGSTSVNTTVLLVGGIALLVSIVLFGYNLYKKSLGRNKHELTADSQSKIPTIYQTTVHFFADRLASSFPGQRGLKWYSGKDAVKRLKVLLKSPLRFEPTGNSLVQGDPIWWFRGAQSMYISFLETLRGNHIVIDGREYKISRIAVNVDQDVYKSFVYIETEAQKPIGLHSYEPQAQQERLRRSGYLAEEYALFRGKPITLNEYNDRATIIRGKPVDAFDAVPRIRFLSPYNFIITAKASPINSLKFTKDSTAFFDGILRASVQPEELFSYINNLHREEGYMSRYSDE